MDRRALMAAFAGIVPAVAAGQEATPEGNDDPGSVLRRYLTEVWMNRNLDAVADYFDPAFLDLLDVQREHRIMIDGIDESRPLAIRNITSDATTAMAYNGLLLASGELHDMFIIVHVLSNGLISSYRWMTQPEQ